MDYLNFLIMPSLIFFARILDVSIGTIKLIFISRGYKKIAPILAFFEITLWLSVITHVMQNLNNPLNFLAYAFGFSAGTYFGILIEEKLALGNVVFQIITRKDNSQLTKYFEQKGYSYTNTFNSKDTNNVNILSLIVKRKNVDKVAYIIKQFNPNAFYTIEEVKYVSRDQIPLETDKKENIKNSIKTFKGAQKNRLSRGFKKSK